MKFTIDTQNKTVALEEDMTFAELESLKKFIGKGWEKWSMTKTVKEVHHWEEYGWKRWWEPYRVTFGAAATPYTDTTQILCDNSGSFAFSTNADVLSCMSIDSFSGNTQ